MTTKTLCTFSGKYGDILWSLPTARFIAEKVVGERVDFAVMPYYENLCPLLEDQSYIRRAFPCHDWVRTNSNYGDQPWSPPEWLSQRYERKWHLTYRAHPGISAPAMPLVEFIAYQQGIRLEHPVVPFLRASQEWNTMDGSLMKMDFEHGSIRQVADEGKLISYAFNDQYEREKKEFLEELWKPVKEAGLEMFNLNGTGWREAAWALDHSIIHVGCRSACWVLATGLGKKSITFEPHPSRHRSGHLGNVFSCPMAEENPLPFGMPPQIAAGAAFKFIMAEIERRGKQNVDVESAVGQGRN